MVGKQQLKGGTNICHSETTVVRVLRGKSHKLKFWMKSAHVTVNENLNLYIGESFIT